MFSNHKFYWENFNMGHSPPLGTRGGWVSLAIMPFMLYVSVICRLKVYSSYGIFAGHLLLRRTPLHSSPEPPTRNYRSGIGGRRGSCVRTHPTQFNFVSYRMPMSVVNRTDFAALVHTLPFIVYNIRWGQMEARYAASAEYWTGIACLVPMVIILACVLHHYIFLTRSHWSW